MSSQSLDEYTEVIVKDPKTVIQALLGHQIPHVFQLHAPGLIPTDLVQFGHIGQRYLLGHSPDFFLEPFDEPAMVPEPGKKFGLHDLAPWAINTEGLEFQIDRRITGINISNKPKANVIPTALTMSAGISRFF